MSAPSLGNIIGRACWHIVDEQWAISGPEALTAENLIPLFSATAESSVRAWVRGQKPPTPPQPTPAVDSKAFGDRKVIPPRAEWVIAYSHSISYPLDVPQFIDFYQSKGWKVGAVRMKDWQAAVRTWKRRHPEHVTGKVIGRDYSKI